MAKYGQKEIFTTNGYIDAVKVAGMNTTIQRHTFVPLSQKYLHDCLNRIPRGKKVQVTFSEHVAIRSTQQLRYHMVLMGYIANHSGLTKDETHDAVMRLKFGTKKVKIGDRIIEVRKSLSEEGKLPDRKSVV